MARRADPFLNLRFILEIDGLVTAGFSRCDLPAATSQVVEYREGTDRPTPRKLPGLNGYGPLVLETGVTDRSIELFEWRAIVERGMVTEARRSIAVVLLDAAGEPAARWAFRDAWPSRYEAPGLSATADEVAIERLVVVHEGFERVAIEARRDDESDDVGVDDGDEGDGGDDDEPTVRRPVDGLPEREWPPRSLAVSPREKRRPADASDGEPEEP